MVFSTNRDRSEEKFFSLGPEGLGEAVIGPETGAGSFIFLIALIRGKAVFGPESGSGGFFFLRALRRGKAVLGLHTL